MLQWWVDRGFREVSFTSDNTLSVANTQPACIQGRDGTAFFNNANLGLMMPPGACVVPCCASACDSCRLLTAAVLAGKGLFSVGYADGRPISQATVDTIDAAAWNATCVLSALASFLAACCWSAVLGLAR